MHEEQPRLFGQHVTVDGSHFDAVRAQSFDNGIYFFSRENEVPRYCGLATARGLEVNCGRNPQRARRGAVSDSLA